MISCRTISVTIDDYKRYPVDKEKPVLHSIKQMTKQVNEMSAYIKDLIIQIEVADNKRIKVIDLREGEK